MTKRGATILGFTAATAVPPLLMSILALPKEPQIHGVWDALVFVAAAFMVFLPYSALFALIIGVPTFLLLRRFVPITLRLATLFGGLVGMLAAVPLQAGQSLPELLLKFALFGSIAGAVFWLIAMRGSDDTFT